MYEARQAQQQLSHPAPSTIIIPMKTLQKKSASPSRPGHVFTLFAFFARFLCTLSAMSISGVVGEADITAMQRP